LPSIKNGIEALRRVVGFDKSAGSPIWMAVRPPEGQGQEARSQSL